MAMVVQEEQQLSLVDLRIVPEDTPCHLYLWQKSGVLGLEQPIEVFTEQRSPEVTGDHSIRVQHGYHHKIAVL